MEYLPIAFITDKNFFVPTVVAVTSLLENKNVESKYVIYIVCVGFMQDQIAVLRQIEKRYKTDIRVVDIDEGQLKSKYSDLVEHDCNATISALIKFDLPYICAEEKKLLYLDGDIIVQEDLMLLNELKLENKYVAAVKDSGLLYSDRLIRQNNSEYFNSGVMYLNLDEMRRDGISEKLVRAKKEATDNSLMDQHVLNDVFREKKILIDYKYNTLYVNLRRAHYFHNLGLETVNDFCGKSYSSWEDIVNKAAIIHYSSFDKPWKYADVNGVEIWDKYFMKSLVSSQKLERKHLYTRKVEKMMEHSWCKIFGMLFWEVETKGLKRCFKEVGQKIKREWRKLC